MSVAEQQRQASPELMRGAAAAAPKAPPSVAGTPAWTQVPRQRFLILSLIVLLLTALAGGWLGLRHVEQRLESEILPASQAIGTSLAQQFELALDAGIPFDDLAGVEPFLATVARFDERVGFSALLDAQGALRYAAGPESAGLPNRLELPAQEGAPLRLRDQLAVPQPLHLDGQLQGYAVVGIYGDLPWQTLRSFLLAALLIVLALGVLLRELLAGLLFHGLQRPAEALARLADAVERGDLSRTTWLEAPGRFGHLIAAARQRLASVNGRFHAFLLTAFATRAGHFDPAVLREVTDTVRRCLANYRLPPVAGAWPIALSDIGLFRLAAFSLFLGECLLAPSWRLLPVLSHAQPQDAISLVVLPLLLAVPLGSWVARRLLVGFDPSLIFTAGALLAAAAALALVLADSLGMLVALRLLSGFGIGIALWPLAGGGVVPHALAMALLAGAAPGYLALLLVGPDVTVPTAALVMAAAGLLVGQLLPAGEVEQEKANRTTTMEDSRDWGNFFPAAAVAAIIPLVPLILQQGMGVAHLDVPLLLGGGLGILLASCVAQWIRGRTAAAGIAAAVAFAAALFLTLAAFAPGDAPAGAFLAAALFLTVIVFLGPRPGPPRGPAGPTLAAAGAFVASLMLTSLANGAIMLLLPAGLLLIFTLSWRRA